MPTIKYIIELSETEREQLTELVTKGTAKARTILRACLHKIRNGVKVSVN